MNTDTVSNHVLRVQICGQAPDASHLVRQLLASHDFDCTLDVDARADVRLCVDGAGHQSGLAIPEVVLVVAPETADYDKLVDGFSGLLFEGDSIQRATFVLRHVASAPRVAKDSVGSRMIAVVGAKGGVGRTTVATNLGALCARSGRRTLLIDLDLSGGDVALLMGITPTYTLSELMGSPGTIDGIALEGHTCCTPSGVHVLPAPVREDADRATRADSSIAAIIEAARTQYDIVILDTPPTWDASLDASISGADDVCVVASLDVAAVKEAAVTIERLEALSVPHVALRLIINRSTSKVGLSPRDVSKVLHIRDYWTVPSSRQVPISQNRGVTVVEWQDRSDVSRRLSTIASELLAVGCTNTETSSSPKKGRARLLGSRMRGSTVTQSGVLR